MSAAGRWVNPCIKVIIIIITEFCWALQLQVTVLPYKEKVSKIKEMVALVATTLATFTMLPSIT